MKRTTKARIHRFRDYVGVYFGNGETVYLSADLAKTLADKMLECVSDIKDNAFQDSAFSTFNYGE